MTHYTAAPGIVVPDPKRQTTAEKVKNEISKLVDVVCEDFGITRNLIMSPIRRRKVADARKAIYYLGLNYLRVKERHIAEVLDVDRSSVYIGSRKAQDLMETDEQFASQILSLAKLIVK